MPINVYADYEEQITYIIQKYNLKISAISVCQAGTGCFNFNKL
jgi:hypothetical protein